MAGASSVRLDVFEENVLWFDPGVEGFFWLVGQGGYGIQTAPAMSQLAADLVLGRHSELPVDTVAALSPARFR